MLIEVLKETIMITGLVLVMMLILEFINIGSHGKWSQKIEKSPWIQILLASSIGAIPGCLGSYTVVSLYTHNFIGFGALIAAMIATMGDETYVMLSLFPQKTLLLMGILFVLAVSVGAFMHFIVKKEPKIEFEKKHFTLHQGHDNPQLSPKSVIDNFRNITIRRAILIVAHILFIVGMITGEIGEHHEGTHAHWGWVEYSFLILASIGLYVVITVSDHFLEHHIWEHVIKKHFLRIFLWTFGALFLIELAVEFIDLNTWIKANPIIVLFVAVLIGLIPISGPHLFFVTTFATGALPFSILLANSIVQDGHGALPLLAETRYSFIRMKAIKLLIGIIIGGIGLLFGF